jgi:hypothetical protein
MSGGVLPEIGAPATRALAAIGITGLDDVADRSEAELLALHGVGPERWESSGMRSRSTVNRCVPERRVVTASARGVMHIDGVLALLRRHN